MKDLIIGAISNYTYDHVKYWINSIQRSGFTGDIALVATNIKHEDLLKISKKGVTLMVYGHKDAQGNIRNDSRLAPHVERFFYIWNFLRDCETYRYVITTDVRDVVFQFDPVHYLEKLGLDDIDGFIAASEGLVYKDEPWNNGNFELAFGPFFHNIWKEREIYNVGVIAGAHERVRDMMLMIYQMGINRPFEVVDQAVYNFMLGVGTFGERVHFSGNDEGWACNLGTTIHAIKSGHGDIGRLADEKYMEMYNKNYRGLQPVIQSEKSIVHVPTGEIYAIVHQYDRVNGLKEKIMEKFDD